jgi:hypothetical protein
MLERLYPYMCRCSRACARQGWKASLVAVMALLGVVSTGDAIDPPRDRTPMPWDTAEQATPEVRRLGLSATLLDTEGPQAAISAPVADAKSNVAKKAVQSLELGDVAIGDTVTVTTADGLSQVYMVTGRETAAANQSAGITTADAKPHSEACVPLESVAGSLRLILETIHAGKTPPAPSIEQRL